jgi:hypothetical protein
MLQCYAANGIAAGSYILKKQLQADYNVRTSTKKYYFENWGAGSLTISPEKFTLYTGTAIGLAVGTIYCIQLKNQLQRIL